jgi:hypothetical protein
LYQISRTYPNRYQYPLINYLAQLKVEEATRKNAKSILLTEDVLSVNFNALSSQRHSYCDRTDLEPDLIQVNWKLQISTIFKFLTANLISLWS